MCLCMHCLDYFGLFLWTTTFWTQVVQHLLARAPCLRSTTMGSILHGEHVCTVTSQPCPVNPARVWHLVGGPWGPWTFPHVPTGPRTAVWVQHGRLLRTRGVQVATPSGGCHAHKFDVRHVDESAGLGPPPSQSGWPWLSAWLRPACGCSRPPDSTVYTWRSATHMAQCPSDVSWLGWTYTGHWVSNRGGRVMLGTGGALTWRSSVGCALPLLRKQCPFSDIRCANPKRSWQSEEI